MTMFKTRHEYKAYQKHFEATKNKSGDPLETFKYEGRKPSTTQQSKIVAAAEELRHEGKGSSDPMYNNSKKDK